ncbi:MAG: sialidase family protein [Pseudobdellovibrio sp.]
MNIKFLFLILILISNCAPKSDSSSSSGASFPLRIAFSGIGSHGLGDASLIQEGSGSRLWMSYSAVDASALWPTQNPDVVSTRLAYSDDSGANWTDSVLVNSVSDVTLPLSPPNNSGSWVNETSQLVYDPGAASGEHYKLIWHRYLITGGTRQFADGWLSMKMSDSLSTLAAATEVKLFSGSAYDTNASIAGSPLFPPVSGAPHISLDTLAPSLNACAVFSEPGLMATSTALYMTATCSTASDALVVLFKCSSPCNVTNSGSWTYLGTLFNKASALALGFDSGFTASSLFQGSDGSNYISVTPQQTAGAPWADYYKGCYIYKFSNIDSATLSSPAAKIISGTSGSFNGACAYHKAATGSGVVYIEVDTTVTDKFKIYSSGVNF